MKNAYDRTLRRRAKEAADTIGLTLKEGVYTMMGGPNFETPAELRIMKMQGVDAVGNNANMSLFISLSLDHTLSLFLFFSTSLSLFLSLNLSLPLH